MKQIDHNQFWLIKDNPITKAGVFPYLGKQISPELEPDKIYQVYRPAEEIRKAADTFKLVPLVDNHTMIGKDFTPAEEKGVHGVLGEEIKEKDGVLYADVKIFSESLKNLIQNGKKELSLGYFCEYDLTPGEYHGVHYDAVQRSLRGNHIALVDNGRMGHDVRVMDSAEGEATRQFVCDSMDLEGKFEEKESDEMKQKVTDAKWEESKHKRDSDGKFSSTGGGAKSKKEESSPKEYTFEELKDRFGDDLSLVLKSSAKVVNIKNDEEVESFFKKADKMKDELGRLKVDQFKKDFNEADQKEYARQEDEMRKYGDNLKERYLNAPSNVWEDYVKAHNKYFASDLSSKTNGVGGKDAAPNKENEMDKREAIREIMAISAKPVSEFAGGEEEKVETIAKIAEKLAYKPSETSKADDACGKDAEVDKRKLIDEIGGILKDKVSEEIIRTIMGKAEELAYNKSEAGSADDEEEPKEESKLADKVNEVEKSMDELPAKVLKILAAREALYSQVQPLVGAFDHAAMTEEQVAKYACDKLDIKDVEKGQHAAVLKGYLKAQKPVQIVSMDAGLKSEEKDAGFEAFLKGEK